MRKNAGPASGAGLRGGAASAGATDGASGTRGPGRTPRDELAEATAHGDVYLRRLRRAQLTLSLLALTAFGAIVGVLPVALLVVPALQHWTLAGVPVGLVLLVVPLFPLFIAIGWIYQRRADALDASFKEIVDR